MRCIRNDTTHMLPFFYCFFKKLLYTSHIKGLSYDLSCVYA